MVKLWTVSYNIVAKSCRFNETLLRLLSSSSFR